MKKVKVGKVYIFDPVMLDKIDPPKGFIDHNEKVRVINLPGCPTANTMSQCYIARVDDTTHGKSGEFLGMVSVHSLKSLIK